MSIPLWTLLGFAVWTVLIVFCSIGVYRWGLILTGRANLSQWRADEVQGSSWYQRSMRAHMNAVENLPVYAAIVLVLFATKTASPAIDVLAILVLVGRVCQTLVHIVLEQTNAVVAIRFALYLAQAGCMLVIAVIAAIAVSG